MRFYFIKNKTEFLAALLPGLSAVFGLVILVKAGGLLITPIRTGMLVKKAIAQSSLDPNEAEKYFAKSKELAEELKKYNLFVPTKPEEHPVKKMSGILGNEALINGKWYKVGDKIGEAEVLAIEPVQVKIRWKSQEKYFSPIGTASVPEPKKKKEKPAVSSVKNENTTATTEKPTVKEAVVISQEEDPLAWMGIKLSEKIRAKLLEKWNTLSDEQKEQFKKQWNNMSDEQKQQAVDAWEQHL